MLVASAACELPGSDDRQTEASLSGVKYTSATREEIRNLGEVVLPLFTVEGTDSG